MGNRTERSEAILEQLLSGKTLRAIGDELGISRQRVHQILTPIDGAIWAGHRLRAKVKRELATQEARRYSKSRRWANKPVDRFWENVDIRGEDECWEWRLARTSLGYGDLQWGEHTVYAHRVAWELTNGPIPDRMCICHHCDNPPCCNPAHLFLGTQRDNVQDSITKGRFFRRGHAQQEET